MVYKHTKSSRNLKQFASFSLVMAFHFRKLLNQTGDDPTIPEICKSYCTETENPGGICPFVCGPFCLNICRLIITIPPPTSTPNNTGFPGLPPTEKDNSLTLFHKVSLAVLSTIFFLILCRTICKFYSTWHDTRRRQAESVEMRSGNFLDVDHPTWYIRTVGLQPSVINAIRVAKYRKGDGCIQGLNCSVCLNEFQEDENLRLLPKCNHAFHMPCIDTWLSSHTNCPICRTGIVNNTEVIVENSNPVEETQGVINSSRENDAHETRIGIEEDADSRAQVRVKNMNKNHREDEGNSAEEFHKN